MNADVARFLEEFALTQFNHSDDLVAGLRSGTIQLYSACTDSELPASHYLHIYEHRLKRLDERFGSQPTEHTQSLRFDTSDLCDGLRGDPEELCDLWIFTEEPYFDYGVFIGRESRQIFGCIRGVDNRLVTPEIRVQLWGRHLPDREI